MVFEKTLTDIVKGIRASKRDTALYISSCIAEIKSEINSTDPYTKANALQKLTFLQMMGYNMSWAAFATIEVMSDGRFAHKRIGHLAASQAFTQQTDVVLLTTNTLKKELRGAVGPGMNGVYEAGLAINCLTNIVTEDLARELLPDVTNLTAHPQPYLRKKAILCLLKLFMKYPQGLRLTFNRIQQCLLEDTNPSVTSCAVNVITELSDKNPKNYLVLAPTFFALLTNSSNNWMLIKVVKLLGSLVGEEPRLARKLLEPLAQIVKNTQAKSLLFEAVYTITLSLPYCRKTDGSMPSIVPSIVELCAETLKEFVQESDQNLKYLGLVGFGSLMVSHPKVLSAPDYRPLILKCLSDDDVTIRTRALGLLISMATRKNIMELVTQLLKHVELATGTYKVDLVMKIVEMCCCEKYALLTDFIWYMDILVLLARTSGLGGVKGDEKKRNLGPLISGQIVDVTLRVMPVRPYAVRRMIGILLEGKNTSDLTGTHVVNMMPEVLSAAAWIVGEYSSLIDDAVAIDEETDDELYKYNSTSRGTYHAVIQALTDPSNIDKVAHSSQSVYIQASMKLLASASASQECKDEKLEACLSTLSRYLPVFMQSMEPEVQERAFTSFQLLSSFGILSNQSSPSSMPEMQRLDHDDGVDESSDDDSGNPSQGQINAIDDLLNLGMSTASNLDEEKQLPHSNILNAFNLNSSAVSKCRAASSSLTYLLVAEPMKPISNKAQRKKKQTAPSMIREALEKPTDMSVFSKLLEGDKARKVSLSGGNNSISMESISFTQLRPVSTVGAPTASNANGIGHNLKVDLASVQDDLSASFQHHAGGNSQSTTVHSSLNKTQDPFYLNASGQNDNDSKAGNPYNRFGTIQLLGSDDTDNSHDNRRSKNKKKKKRKVKKDRNKITDVDAELIGLGGVTHNNQEQDMKLYNSDDDDDDDDNDGSVYGHTDNNNFIPSKKQSNRSNLQGFESLAMVDLTTPLEAHEVMPVSKHRALPDTKAVSKRVEEKDLTAHKSKHSGKKQKKKREKKSKSSRRQKEQPSESFEPTTAPNETADLLGFSGFGQPNDEVVKNTPGINAINSAFDDLLDLDGPILTKSEPQERKVENTSTPLSNNLISSFPEESTRRYKVWQKAVLKASHAKGGTISIDWSQVILLYRTSIKKKSNEITVTLKLLNRTNDSVLENIEISVKGAETSVVLERTPPGSASESQSRIGPFQPTPDGLSPEIRGTMKISGWKIPVKMPLPSTSSLKPVNDLLQDQVLSLLSEDDWASFSTKINASSISDNSDIKGMLKTFLKVGEVEPDANDVVNGIFAAKSTSGAQVLVLLKNAKHNHLKVDVKSNNNVLAKTLSTDLGRVYF